ncbi:MAG: response regulator [Bacteroidota bacterium]|nr:response regulator [Bacteroidota bacterium]
MKIGPILLVEDDVDDQEFIKDALHALGVKNTVSIFDNGQKALDYLLNNDEQPFIILSDVNLPIMNGLQLKSEIQQNEFLRKKAIPFIFLSTSADAKAVSEAFDLSVQGFFVKENTYDGIQRQLKQIIDYWKSCRHPNSTER